MYFDQGESDLKCDWGLPGLLALLPNSSAVIIVDVLSFSTAVDIALASGATVLPYRWKDDSAGRFAGEQHAVLAGGRSTGVEYSLSPASLRSIPPGTRLVLPSPNGSALSLAATGVPLFTACLRNAPAVARQAAAYGPRIAVIPAGEQWPDAALRPCLEDLIGAGAVLSELPGTSSPEAAAAIATFARFRHNPGAALSHCGSGKELLAQGFALDVELAAQHAVSQVVPMLIQGQFIDAAPRT